MTHDKVSDLYDELLQPETKVSNLDERCFLVTAASGQRDNQFFVTGLTQAALKVCIATHIGFTKDGDRLTFALARVR